jgi:subtilisin
VGLLSHLVCGIDFVTATRTDKSKKNDIAVANMSLAGRAFPDDGNCGRTVGDPVHLAICGSVAGGVTYVVAASNEADTFSPLHFPANYDEVLTATAMADYDGEPGGIAAPECLGQDLGGFGGRDDHFATFSNFATLPADQAHTIAGPGVCIGSTAPIFSCQQAVDPKSKTCYSFDLHGTSFASPHVAGVAALCIASAECSGTPAQIIQKLRSDARAYNQANPGYGFVGDPLRPISGRYYGYLIPAGLY